MTSVLFVCVICVFILALVWKLSAKKYAKPEPPKNKGWLPIIGHAHHIVGDTAHLWNYMKRTVRTAFEDGTRTKTLNLGPFWTVYVLSDVEDCVKVATTCLSKDVVYDVGKPWLGNGLATGAVPIWKRHRKLLNPAFTQKVLNGYMGVLNQYARELADTLSSKAGTGFVNPHVEIQDATFELNCATSMGLNEKANAEAQKAYMGAVSDYLQLLVKRVQSIWMQSDLLFNLTPYKWKEMKLRKHLHNMTTEVINKKREELQNYNTDNDGKPKSFLQYMIELTDESVFAEHELREETDTLIVAGFDTTSYFIVVALVVLGSFPEVQERAYNEIMEVLDGSDRDLGKDDLPRLVYLTAVLKEVLRLYPIFGFVGRYLDQDIELKNYTLRAGASCFLFLWGINRDPKTWGEDADQFKPERFLDRALQPEDTNCFASFSFGQRGCIGARFAMMSGQVFVAHVLRNYKIFADYTKLKFHVNVMVTPYEGCDMKIEKRK